MLEAADVVPPEAEATSDVPARDRSISFFGRLFPIAERSTLPPGVIALGYAAAFVTLTITALLRQSGVPATGSIWGEDATIFYQQSLEHPFWSTLTLLYNGYMQLVPRLEIWTTHLFPPARVSTTIAVVGAASLAVLVLVVFHASRGLLRSPMARVALVAAMVLLPMATGELLDNIVNITWWLFIATFWVLLWRPRSVAGSVVAFLVCGAATASNPLVVLLLPLVVVRVVCLPRWRDQSGSVGFALGLVYQLVVILRAGYQSLGSSSFAHVPDLFAIRVGLGWLTGNRITDALISSHGGLATVLGVLLLAVIVALALVERDPVVRPFLIAALTLSVLTFVVPVGLRGAAPVMNGSPVYYGARYAATPLLLVVSLLLVMADRYRPGMHARQNIMGVVLVALLLAPAWIVDFRGANERSMGPEWSQQLDRAKQRCTSGGTGIVTLHTSPTGWSVHLTCAEVLAG